MKRIDDDQYDPGIENYLMSDEEKKIYDINKPAKEEILRTTRYYEVNNISDLLDEDNMAELTLTEPLSKRVVNAQNEAMKDRFKDMSKEEMFEWQRYNLDHKELDELLEYLRQDFSVSYAPSINLVLVDIHNVYAMKFKPEIHKTWQALEFEVYDGVGGVVKATALYRRIDIQNDDLFAKLEMLQKINGSQPVDILFSPLPTNYKNKYGKLKEAEIMIQVIDIRKIDGDRNNVFIPEPVEYNVN